MIAKSFAALAVISLLLGGAPGKAQTANAGANSTSSSGSTSGASSSSGSTSNSGASANTQRSQQRATNTSNTPITFNSTTPDRLTTNGTGSYSNNSSGYTTSDVIVRTTPTVYAPPVSGGNPCTLAVSGGVSVIGWGAAAGGTFVDEDCANRQKIAMIHNAGYAQAARELMCNDRATYMAFRGTATPCNSRPAFDGVPVAGPAPAPVLVTPAAPPPIQRTTSAPARRCTGPNDQGPCVQGS